MRCTTRWAPGRSSWCRGSPTAARWWRRTRGWWDKPVHNLDRVEFNVIARRSTRVAALLSGEMDMIYSVPPQDMARIKRTRD